MKRYLKKIFVFALAFFILALALDVYLSAKVKQVDQYPGEFQVWSDIEDGIECQLAIYGSSRAWIQYDSQILEDSTGLSTYNFGIDGHCFDLQYLRHLKFTQNNPEPEVVIVNVDEFQLIEKVDLYENQQFLTFMLWDFQTYAFLKKYNGLGLADFLVPSLRFMGRKTLLQTALSKSDGVAHKFRQKGYRGNDKAWGFMVTEPNDSTKIDLPLNEEQVALFERFLIEMNSKQIQVILVWAPEHFEAQSRVSNRQNVVDYFQQVANQYEVPFWDFSQQEMCDNKKYFYNGTHLNVDGATKFSSMLGAKLNSFFQNSVHNNQNIGN